MKTNVATLTLVNRIYWTFKIWIDYLIGFLVNSNHFRKNQSQLLNSLVQVQSLIYPKKLSNNLLKRIGGEYDGAYFVPDDWDSIQALFSPGVGSTTSFDSEFARKGIPVFLIDPGSYESSFFSQHMHFRQGLLGSSDSPGMTTLTKWIADAGINGDYALQIDIEGNEHQVLAAFVEQGGNFNIFRYVIVEIHKLFEYCSDKGKFSQLMSWLNCLLRDHIPVATLPATFSRPIKTKFGKLYDTVEVTFVRKSDYEFVEFDGENLSAKGFRFLPSQSFSQAARLTEK